MKPQPDPALRQAVSDLQRYLSDQVAPLLVVDSLETLVASAPGVVASAIEAWVASQYRGASSGATVSDYLFHAMKKLNLMGQLRLIDRRRLAACLEQVGPQILEMCPEEDRDALRATLRALGDAEGESAPALELLHMRAAPGAPGGAAPAAATSTRQPGGLGADVARGLRQFGLLVERLARGPGGAPRAAGQPEGEAMRQLLAAAAMSSPTGADLEIFLDRLGQQGIKARTEEVFQALGRSLAGWALPSGAGGGAAAAAVLDSRPAQAMRRLVSTAGDPAESRKRFTELVRAAVEQFNEGNLARAATIFDVAARIVSERKIDLDSAKLIQGRAEGSLSTEQLRRAAERTEKHAPLRTVLDFFPGLTVRGLLAALEGEEKRDRRKLLTALLQAHGAPAREACLATLETRLAADGLDPRGYYARNLVFLLRHIPGPGPDPEREVALLHRLAKLDNPHIVIREAIGALGQVRGGRTEQALISLLREFESALLQAGEPRADAEELRVLLDRTASALTRMGSPGAYRTVVNHAFRAEPALGRAMARLVDLGTQDLSGDKELVDHLAAALKSRLPRKVLGFVLKKADDALLLVQALSGTPAPAVTKLFEEIVERFPTQEFTEAASKALAGFGAPARPAEPPAMSLSGDLDLFGLPSLMQTVADARMSGLLSILDRQGRTVASVTLSAGKVRECLAGRLAGESAFYQLFEKPLVGTFAFKSRRDAEEAGPPQEALLEVLPAMLEAIRRYDEFEQARILVPDDAGYRPAGAKPTAPQDGEDPDFLRTVWSQASAGATPAACEAAVAADSYRIRRLYAHWVEQGALQPK